MRRHFARKTECALGHKHASAREAARCAELTMLFRDGKIDALAFEPRYEFNTDRGPIKMGNGATMRFTPDFSYLENGKLVVEDVKSKTGFVERDVPLRFALFRHLFPHIELRVVK